MYGFQWLIEDTEADDHEAGTQVPGSTSDNLLSSVHQPPISRFAVACEHRRTRRRTRATEKDATMDRVAGGAGCWPAGS